MSAASDIDSREQLIKDHYAKRINEITLQLQLADSKSVNFHAEVRALHKQLLLADKTKSLSQDELKVANQTLAQLKVRGNCVCTKLPRKVTSLN